MEDNIYLEEFEESESINIANQKAEEIIQKCKQRKLKNKQMLVRKLLSFINDACEKHGWEYFAVKELLSNYLEGIDGYPDLYEYEIWMMRKTFEAFQEYVEVHARENEIQVQYAYFEDARVRNIDYALSGQMVTEDELGKIDTQVTIKIVPYDNLPEDNKKREVFLKEAMEKAAWYNGLSGYVSRNILKQKSIKTFLNLKFRYNRTYLENYKKNYKEFISQYRDVENAEHCGRLELQVSASIDKKDIFPVKKVVFMGTELMLPSNVDKFSTLNEKQHMCKIADIACRALARFNKLCEEYGVSYFAIGKFLIECVKDNEEMELRNGALKWRVGILREDYEKILIILRNEETAGGLVLKEYQDSFPYIKQGGPGILCKEDDKKDARGYTYPVYLDVFDNLPEDYLERCKYKQEVAKMKREYNTLVRKQTGRAYPKRKIDANDQLKLLDEAGRRYCDNAESNLVFRSRGENSDTISLNEIFPVKKKKFRGIEVFVPNNQYIWHEKNDEGFTENIINKKTKILKILDEICHEQNIAYFAISKLLVGAVVYHDVVPNSGDASLDIGLLRMDFERLLSYLRKNDMKHGITLNEYKDNEKRYPEPTKYITMKGEEYSIIRIKILPFDKLPESFYLREYFRDKMKEMNQKYLELLDYKIGNTSKYLKMYTVEEWKNKEVEYKQMDLISFAKEIDEYAQSYNDDENAFGCERVAFRLTKIIDVDDIFPVQRQKFRDIEIDCPKDYSPWQPVLNEDLNYQVSCIQKADLRLLEEMDRVCREIGVGYFICGGTMLGYMRHQGFIPWDDDVDVAMLRKDYEKFLKEAPQYLEENFFLQTRETDPNIPYLFSKIRLENTEYCTAYNINRDFHKGLCLDIFPFDYVPNDLDERKKFVDEVVKLAKEHNMIARNQYPEIEEPFSPRNEEEKRCIEEKKSEIAKYWEISLEDTQKAYIEKATMYNDKAEELGLKTVASFVPSYTFIELEDLLPYQRGEFEDIEVSVPKRPDIFLEMQYKNYMELPPKHMQVAHRLIRWSDGVHGADNQKKRDYSKIGGIE